MARRMAISEGGSGRPAVGREDRHPRDRRAAGHPALAGRLPLSTGLLLFAVLTLLLPAPACAASDKAWVQPFDARREFHVAPNGSGSGLSAARPMALATAIANCQPGDRYWLLGGDYSGPITLERAGTAAEPIVFRALPGERATLRGWIHITGAYNWVWGLEITDAVKPPSGAAVGLYAEGVHVINNTIRGTTDAGGIGTFDSGSGQVVYGNIISNEPLPASARHPHHIYAQNDFRQHGYKYFSNNVLMDSATTCGNCFNFHGYTEKGRITGLFLEGNIVQNGRFLIGGYGEPADNEVVRGNYFYKSGPELGYRRPTQAEVVDNYIVRGQISTTFFWGEGEGEFGVPKPNIYRGNEVYLPTGSHVEFRTSAYGAEGTRCEGCPRIRPNDIFDGNTYSAPMRASFFANQTNLGRVGFDPWKVATSNSGNAFDANSREVPVPTSPRIVLLPNEYEAGRAHLIIYNWGAASTVSVDLSSLVGTGAAFAVHRIQAVFGSPLLTGKYAGPVAIDVDGQEFAVFLITSGSVGKPGAGR